MSASSNSPAGTASCAKNDVDMTSADILVTIVDANHIRAAILEEGLRAAGVKRLEVIPETPDLLRKLIGLSPDVVIIDLESPSRDMLEQMCAVSKALHRPVAMFVDGGDESAMRKAIDAGVSAYVADGLSSQRVKAIVDEAILRFGAFARMQKELEDARNQLAQRKIIERAKGLLMKRKNMSEEAAYALLRETAMKNNKRIGDIAQALLVAEELMP